MRLQGSCHCGTVQFTCDTVAPYPYMQCYCSICRKTAGAGGHAVNLHADATSLQVTGEQAITVYRAWLDHPQRTKRSDGERRFCSHCGTPLWVWDPRWPELMHPFAAAIDTPLPQPPARNHIMLAYKPDWVPLCVDEQDRRFDTYPDESLHAWHQRHGLLDDPNA